MKKLKIEHSLGDHLLVMVGGASSVFSIGQSLGKPTLAWTLAIMVVFATMAGYGLSRLLAKTPVIRWDAGLWTFLGLFSFIGIPFLNSLLPEGGFPFQILAGGMLSWMIILCSVVSWRDRTLLFLSLPCIALFGLVGTFDTYAPGTWLFFAFLVCTGVLYARVHLRAMAERARLAGADDPALLVRGPWKWMAGPEWAFASGFLIIALSLMGAPVVRQSVQQVAGNVRITLPPPPQQNQNPNRTPQQQTETQIGRGPNNPSETPIFRVKMDEGAHLRSSHLNAYTGTGWSQAYYQSDPDDPLIQVLDSRSGQLKTGPNGGLRAWPGPGLPPGEPLDSHREVRLTFEPLTIMGAKLLAPGPVVEVQVNRKQVAFFGSGDVLLDSPLMPGDSITYWAAVPDDRPASDSRAVYPGPSSEAYRSTQGISPRVALLARNAVKDADTDYEKALAIQRAVTRSVRYNLNAPATPTGADPVEHFLFESKEGYCDLFASSVVLMARSVGLPARYTIGWLVEEDSRTENGYVVREKDYHAWAEIYFEGQGWVVFDATAGAEQVPGGEVGRSRTRVGEFFQAGWILPALAGVLGLAVLLPILIALAKQVKQMMDPAERRKGELAAAHASFHMAIEKLTGSPKRFSQTLREYVDLHSPSLGPLAEEASSLTQKFEAAMFSPKSPEGEELKALSSRVKAFRSSVLEMAKERKQAQSRGKAA